MTRNITITKKKEEKNKKQENKNKIRATEIYFTNVSTSI